MRRSSLIGIALVVLILTPPIRAWTYEAIQVTDGGTISGRVTFSGSVPAPQPIAITRDQAVCGKEPKFARTIVVGREKGLQYAVVSLLDITKGKPFSTPGERPTLDQRGCWFHPPILVIPAGTTFDLLNSDRILHNFHTKSSKNPVLNKAQPGFKKVLPITIKEPEFIQVNCDVHEWMRAWIVTTGHPYYAVTDEAGAFTLTDVPPGTYTLQVWHEALGPQSREVTVKAGGKVNVQVEFKGKTS